MGGVEYFARILKSAVERYGTSESPDHEELLRIVGIIQSYISTMTFNRKIGYPVYPLDSYNDGLRRTSELILSFDKKKFDTIEATKQFFEAILNELYDEDENYTLDQMSR